jgi:MFS family permease
MINFTSFFRSLQNRNYRLFFAGQSVSLIGTWMQEVALGWLVYRMTNSALLLGLVGFSTRIPSFLLSPMAGVIADRYNRHRILILTQTLAMVQAVVLSWLVLTGQIAIWQIIALSVFIGIVNAFDIPVRQSFVIEMVEKKEDLSNAIALNSSMVNMARLVGPSIAGILIAMIGEGMCFLLNAVTYLAVIASLLLMTIAPFERKYPAHSILRQLRDGFAYVTNSAPIKVILLLLGLTSLVGGGLQTLMPVFARDIFFGGPKTLGYLMAGSGLGALVGALYLAGRPNVLGLGRLIAKTSALFGIGVVLFAVCRNFGLAVTLVSIAGFGMMVQMASSNTVLQMIVDDDKRGRIMSFYTMAFMGMAPLGSLVAGWSSGKIGAPQTMVIGGIFCLIGSFFFRRQIPMLREKIRPIYAQKGIIPQVADGIQSATAAET